MQRANKSGWKWILVAGACAVAFASVTPLAGLVPVVALPAFAEPQVSPERVKKLMSDLAGGSESKSRLAQAELIHLGPSVIPGMLRELPRDNPTAVRMAITAMEQMGKKDLVSRLTGIEGLNNNDPIIRRNAAAVLGVLNAVDAAPALAFRLGDKDPSVRRDAALAIYDVIKGSPMSPKQAGQIADRLTGFLAAETKKHEMYGDDSLMLAAARSLGRLAGDNRLDAVQIKKAHDAVYDAHVKTSDSYLETGSPYDIPLRQFETAEERLSKLKMRPVKT
jgi:hypothetical protein